MFELTKHWAIFFICVFILYRISQIYGAGIAFVIATLCAIIYGLIHPDSPGSDQYHGKPPKV